MKYGSQNLVLASLLDIFHLSIWFNFIPIKSEHMLKADFPTFQLELLSYQAQVVVSIFPLGEYLSWTWRPDLSSTVSEASFFFLYLLIQQNTETFLCVKILDAKFGDFFKCPAVILTAIFTVHLSNRKCSWKTLHHFILFPQDSGVHLRLLREDAPGKLYWG